MSVKISTKMASKKYYVVWVGKQTGIFDSWEACKAQVNGFAGARYKSFESQQAAEIAFKDPPAAPLRTAAKEKPTKLDKSVAVAARPIMPSLAVDAACSGNPGKMEYRGVDTASGKQFFHYGPTRRGTNNIGEFLAIVHGLAYLQKQQLPNIPIYSDSRNAIKWVKDKQVRTKLERDATTETLFELIERAVAWLQKNTYSNPILKWETEQWGECPADFGRK